MDVVGGYPLHYPPQSSCFLLLASLNPYPNQASGVSPSADISHPLSGAQKAKTLVKLREAHTGSSGDGKQGRAADTGQESGQAGVLANEGNLLAGKSLNPHKWRHHCGN